MSGTNRSALVLGANGLIGKHVTQILLKNNNYHTIFALSRHDLGLKDPKLVNIITNSEQVEDAVSNLLVDDFYSCIGTTRAKTPDLETYAQIDHDYPLKVAKQLKVNGCQTVNLVSSIGANSKSSNYYLRIKGRTEQDIIALDYYSTNIFRPSLLLGKRPEKRILEDISKFISPLLNLLLWGKFKDYRSIEASTVASAMVNCALQSRKGIHIYKTEEIKQLA